MADLVYRRLGREGLKAVRHETSGNLILTGQLGGAASKTILFFNHYDVQPAEPLEECSSPPFEPRVVDDHVIARGTTDNKGNIINRLAAFETFLSVRRELLCSIEHLIQGEEEIGSPSLELFITGNKELLTSNEYMWEDDTVREDIPPLSLGNKGLCYRELRCRTANWDFHSSNAQIYMKLPHGESYE